MCVLLYLFLANIVSIDHVPQQTSLAVFFCTCTKRMWTNWFLEVQSHIQHGQFLFSFFRYFCLLDTPHLAAPFLDSLSLPH